MIVKVEVNLLSHQLNLTAFSLSTLSINPSPSDDERKKNWWTESAYPLSTFRNANSKISMKLITKLKRGKIKRVI